MRRKKSFTSLLLISAVILLSTYACNPAKKFEKEEAAQIQDYLLKNSSLDFVLKPSGLYYLELVEGTGLMPVLHDTAYVKYTGKFLDGTVFDTNVGTTDTLIIPVNEGWLIPGFDEGLTYMKAGGKSTFLMPSSLAYGPNGYYSISGYTPLLFDVEIVKVVLGPSR